MLSQEDTGFAPGRSGRDLLLVSRGAASDRWGADAFGAWFSLVARLAPLHRRAQDGRLALRLPVTGATGLTAVAGTTAILLAAIGSTGFDGAKEGPLFSSLVPDVQDALEGIGLSVGAALEWTFVIGLVACVALVAALYRLGIAGIAGIGGSTPVRERALDYVHTLVPIAVAYVVAHYFSYLVYNVQLMWPVASDPLGDGSDLFGGMAVGLRAHTFAGPSLDDATVELINVAISDINGCKPCTEGHVAKARQIGVSDEALLETIQVAATVSAGVQFLKHAGA